MVTLTHAEAKKKQEGSSRARPIQANIRQNRTRNASQKRAVTLKKVAPYGASQKIEVC